MEWSICSNGRSLCAVAACLVVLAAVVGCGDARDDRLRVVATERTSSVAVAGVEGPEGPLVCAGSSLLEFKRGALDELARVPSTYRIGAMYAGFISSPGYFDGAVQLSGGDLVLVRDVFGPESPDVFSHHELVVMSLA
ncbi:MAG: hypothetical protein Q8M66_00415, partial [Actinomycetota bacterium]|nr:hypothetical protein [Actinomycetota bacterium]